MTEGIAAKPMDIDLELCRDLGDAIFAFFCPATAVILTTILEITNRWLAANNQVMTHV